MDRNVYIVVEIGWEYNDEIYQQYDDNGRPTRAFFSKEEATLVADKLNVSTFDDILKDSYGVLSYLDYSGMEGLGYAAIAYLDESRDDLEGTSHSDDEDGSLVYDTWTKLNSVQKLEFIRLCELKFFIVQSVPIGE